jgi:hypothetical protein
VKLAAVLFDWRCGPTHRASSDISDWDFTRKTGDSRGMSACVLANRQNVQQPSQMPVLAPLVLNTGRWLRIVAAILTFVD